MTDLQKEFEATGYTSWINADLYPDGKIYTQEYTRWLEEQVLALRQEAQRGDGGELPLLSVRACEGSCEIHKGEVIPVIISGLGWKDTKFNYCQNAIEEDERRGFSVRPYR